MTADEEYAVLMFPTGHRFTLLFIAYIKHALVNIKMRAGERLQFLEWINAQECLIITREMIEMIEPASDTEVKMIHEAMSLDHKDDKTGNASFRVLTSEAVFKDFLGLNPSLLAAIMVHSNAWLRLESAA